MNNYYYGLPQDQWDNLILKAEDILHDENLGSHLVGIYPIGNRLFGLESESPGVFCLYVNSVEELLDPARDLNRKSVFKYYHEGHCNCPIIMTNLFDWASWLITPLYSDYRLLFCNIIPCYGDIIHQDDSIVSIIDSASEYLKETQYNSNLLHGIQFAIHNREIMDNPPPTYLVLRTYLILRELHKFNPNVSSNWGTVISAEELNYPSQFIELDREVLRAYENNLTQNKENLDILISYLWGKNSSSYHRISTKEEENLRKAVIDFYRFQL